MEISVIIPTCGRVELLARCLRALLHQRLGAEAYEILIVDDSGGGMPLKPLLVPLHAWPHIPPRVKVLQTMGNEGPAAARNLGARHASGRILAFTDDDTIPDTAWLLEGLASFDDQVIAVTGRVVVPLPQIPTDYELNESRLALSEFVTANCFVRRDVFEDLNGFDTQFKMAWREDSDLHFRLLDRAAADRCHITRAQMAVVVHPVRPAPWGVSMAQQRKAMYNALLFKKHPQHYRARIQRGIPWSSYAAVLSAVGVLTATVAGAYPAAAFASLLWSALVLRFMLQRLRSTSRHLSHVGEMMITSACIPFLSVFWRITGALKFRVLFF